jgi:hypothetical protein
MRRVVKDPASVVITNNLSYIPGNSANNRQLADVLLSEQKGFCVYTDEYISRSDARDVEHFNPSLKGTAEDSYNNWFVVKHQWNKEKSDKWGNYQPILHPTADDFEERVVYIDGDYFAVSEDDLEAKNLIKLLRLDDPALAIKRKKYLTRKRDEMSVYGVDALSFFMTLIEDDICQVHYIRAIKEEFNVDLWEVLN